MFVFLFSGSASCFSPTLQQTSSGKTTQIFGLNLATLQWKNTKLQGKVLQLDGELILRVHHPLSVIKSSRVYLTNQQMPNCFGMDQSVGPLATNQLSNHPTINPKTEPPNKTTKQ